MASTAIRQDDLLMQAASRGELEKVRAMLSVCAEHGHDAVVLGAIGCGAFQQDPRTVAKAFEHLLRKEFRFFHVAIFAILHGGPVFDEFAAHFRATSTRHLDDDLMKMRKDNPS